jgi:hypothetical protein
MIDPNTVDYSKISTADIDENGNIIIVDRLQGQSPFLQSPQIREFLSDVARFYLEAKKRKDYQEPQTENHPTMETHGNAQQRHAVVQALEKHLCKA